MSTPTANLDDDVDSTYLSIFTEYLADFRAHLAGRESADAPLSASFFAPRAFWTSAEKDAFFRALAVHSRLRPDLIAAEVKSKTVPDVCVYLAMLEKAAKETSEATTYVGDRGHTVNVKLPRKELPTAIEVSDEWIEYEERMANSMVILERAHEPDVVLQEREEEVNTRRTTIRAPRGGARTASNERDREGEKERREAFENWLAQKRLDWVGEDLLLSLDKVGLATLDRILRDDEEGRMFSLDSAEDAHNEEPPVLSEPLEVHGAGTATIGEDLIDPILLELSRATVSSPSPHPSGMSATQYALRSTPTTLPSHDIPLPPPQQCIGSFQPNTPPFTPVPLPTSEVEGPEANSTPSIAPSVKTDGSTLSGEDPSQMSPTSRRRYQKRLYMRRKRAKETGATVNENTERLKPGRKPKKRPEKAQSSTPAVEDVHEQAATPSGEAEGEENAAYRHPHVSGLTLPYKRQAEFVSMGVDAPRLRREGLDLFHLQGISKLMQTYNELHDVDSTLASEISAETLRLLRGLVVRFVSQVMSRAIVSREQERIAKLQTKAWRLKENQVVSSANVRHALALCGADSLSKRTHFARLLRKLDLDESEDAEAQSDEEQQAEDTVTTDEDDDAAGDDVEDHGPDEEASLPLEPLSLLRTMCPPFMNPPSSSLHYGGAPDSPDPSVYMPWPSSSLLTTAPEPPRDEDILPEQLDEAELARELNEESLLEYDDSTRDKEGEHALWVRVGKIVAAAVSSAGQPPGDEKPEPSRGRTTERPPRRKRRRVSEGASADERDVEAELLGDTRNADDDPDAVEEVAPRGGRKKRKKGKAYLSEQRLKYQEPDPDGRIKSAVYVLDSDSD